MGLKFHRGSDLHKFCAAVQRLRDLRVKFKETNSDLRDLHKFCAAAQRLRDLRVKFKETNSNAVY